MSESTIRASSVTSPSCNKLGTPVEIQNPDTIPIIFIPGIMGSNVRTKKTKNSVWKLGNLLGQFSKLADQCLKTPAQLETELNPLTTEVDPSQSIKVTSKLKLTEKALRKRGWGTVDSGSYGDILTYLQDKLNDIYLEERDSVSAKYGRLNSFTEVSEWSHLLNTDEVKNWGAASSLQPITASEIEHLKKFHFPVYAKGYNWLQSNEDGAQNIAKELDKIKKEWGDKFHKFIIVTHSMGGLLTRRLVQLREADIAGVVHGVMPAEGASLAYRRIVSGCGDAGLIPSIVMGPHTEHTTAVIANSPGSLELLPTPRYNQGKPWLFLKGKDSNQNNYTVTLPKQDPYSEIYKSDRVWWEMVKEDFIDPAKIVKLEVGQQLKDIYFRKIDLVKGFHTKIADHYHPCSYVHYGHDKKNKSFECLTWTLSQPVKGLNEMQLQYLPPANAQQHATNLNKKSEAILDSFEQHKKLPSLTDIDVGKENDGTRYIALSNGELAHFSISSSDSFGDGTVPHVSANAPQGKKGVQQVFRIEGFDHQHSYNNTHVRRSVLYSIVKIIHTNNIQPKHR
ncbi:esterase/lipase family protein [Acinetobacter pollinis]|uniref:esterase/lipase family protein n=1 Tax=Acinetobacter pollinis TaxID=2605270 RepID=UPI0018A3006E|nr:alpha/beta hydrolase [Acinetobacter pollinis]MBF7689629.1 alpha/beta hydrolase [Acinetobacter pollinis]MBF7692653.1 alpha/beta hydrolase [Acinetobacter pollinis]MBF7698248.1 alpha/beta hydrolase [Acinetobacter pollinis]MBF7700657.1 alpha/beta hydrolase [Acinetobacter pollinis]